MSKNNKILTTKLKDIQNIIANKEKRIYACEKHLWLFSLIYFIQYHHHIMPKFHLEMYKDLTYDNWGGVLWEMYRESGKTTLAKIKIIHSIIYSKKKFIIWTSYDQHKAEANLFDIALELQTNKNLIADFGQLFYEDKLTKERFSKKKSIGEFITANRIKVKSYSTGQSIRGEVYQQYRPDLLILDDVETSKTMVSDAKTQQVIEYMDELFSGVSGDADILVLANRLIDNGSIAYLKDKIKNNKQWRYRGVAVKEDDKINWADKYVETIKEAEEVNKNIGDTKKHKISLEQKKIDLGITVYNREMMNQPLSDEEREFAWKWLQNYYTNEEIEKKLLNRYITIDTADSKERENKKNRGLPDFTGTVVVDWDIENNWYIRYAKRKRLNAPEMIEWIFYLWETFKPIKIGVEKKSFEDQIMPYIKLKSEETNIYPVIEELEHGGRRKEDRIRGALQGRFQAGKIKFLANAYDDTSELQNEIYDFPRAKYDDLVDCAAYISELGTRPIIRGNSNILTEVHQEFYENKKPKNNIVNTIKSL